MSHYFQSRSYSASLVPRDKNVKVVGRMTKSRGGKIPHLKWNPDYTV